MFSIELVNMNISVYSLYVFKVCIIFITVCSILNLETGTHFKIIRFITVLQLFYCFSYVTKCNLNLLNKSVFRILEFCHTKTGHLNIIACCI